ncbi:UNVERIFIED_CONTAM: NOL1/NOP2/sun family putative RNA methylase [Acetivibrio alkalicellulosi]
MKVPFEFLEKMKKLLGKEEFDNFVKSYEMPRHYGLRVNTLKISVEEFLKTSPFKLKPIPWTNDGFYYLGEESPGKHPYYHAGLYYIQEPSAMLPGAVADARPGEYVLDLCAAPGGKTVQMAAGMKGKGLLIANDISADRVKALIKNIELCGVTNAIVTNEKPEKLVSKFKNFFDKILVDAPCSGEGMFRKDENAAKSWDKFKSELCCNMQRDILENAHEMLKPGGMLIYSTCTFSPEENEMMIGYFLDRFKEYELMDIVKTGGIDSGRPDWADGNKELVKSVRLWPHKLNGEGHFTALIRKKGHVESILDNKTTQSNSKELEPFYIFQEENLNRSIEGYFSIQGSHLYYLPVKSPDLSGIKISKFGWYLGEFARGRFEPKHSFIIPLKKEDLKITVDFDSKSGEVIKYLKGETLITEGTKGYTGVLVDGYTLGWAKQNDHMLKNLYPKGWRKMV